MNSSEDERLSEQEKTQTVNTTDTQEEANYKGPETADEVDAAVEAILFSMGDSVEAASIAKALELTPAKVWDSVKRLENRYDTPGSGLEIRRMEDSVQLCTRTSQYSNLIRIAKVPKKVTLSDSVIETLSIIAYKQPITKMEIEAIRGVSCEYAINKLLDYDLVRELGRKDAPGRPLLFGTTEQFLRSFGVRNLSELPSLEADKAEEFREEAEQEINGRLGV